jgi:hypothetical protein
MCSNDFDGTHDLYDYILAIQLHFKYSYVTSLYILPYMNTIT